MKSNPNPSFCPALPYELLSSHASIDKKIKKRNINIDLAVLPSHDTLHQSTSITVIHSFEESCGFGQTDQMLPITPVQCASRQLRQVFIKLDANLMQTRPWVSISRR